ncbi:hypothetical protein SAMN04488508_102558 [Aquimarina spongiae]|uniref:Uncharacterized protein n=1 Tax=Aquimarina spongiae TaxID=570521 RepID=A0A1M6DDH7_9FLAO|nr:hypothetical protein SAMN04488508_102558 [Aquimarina spongiae]
MRSEKDNYLKFVVNDLIPANFQFLIKEEKNSNERINLVHSAIHNGKIQVGSFYKCNSNIILLNE